MEFKNPIVKQAYLKIQDELNGLVDKQTILHSTTLKQLYQQLKTLPNDQKADFGKEVNQLKVGLVKLTQNRPEQDNLKEPIDITAPFDINVELKDQASFLPANRGSRHPLMTELNDILDIFYRMGFESLESLELDDDFHMFGSLNFPEGHPARDDFDTFMTKEIDKNEKSFIAPAHTSSMQNRVISSSIDKLSAGLPIATVIAGRVFRNEDLDARHEHTFYQLEGVYVAKNVTVGNLMATLKTFLESYYGKSLKFKTQPFYFPFTEPSFEFALSCPFCNSLGCKICSQSGWIELLGCGIIHPKVLETAGVNPDIYSGFAWGMGIERLVMMKYGIEDIRHFEAAQLNFLRQFK